MTRQTLPTLGKKATETEKAAYALLHTLHTREIAPTGASRGENPQWVLGGPDSWAVIVVTMRPDAKGLGGLDVQAPAPAKAKATGKAKAKAPVAGRLSSRYTKAVNRGRAGAGDPRTLGSQAKWLLGDVFDAKDIAHITRAGLDVAPALPWAKPGIEGPATKPKAKAKAQAPKAKAQAPKAKAQAPKAQAQADAENAQLDDVLEQLLRLRKQVQAQAKARRPKPKPASDALWVEHPQT